jgi:putative peptidoglycan lipid II flippase
VSGTPQGAAQPPAASRDRARAIGLATLIIMAGNLSTSAVGFVRQAATVDVFGTGRTDAWFAASIVPQMFYDLTLGAAVSAALIPIFTEIAERDGNDALGRTVGTVLGLAWLTLAALAVVLIALAGPFMHLVLLAYRQGATTNTVSRSVVIVRVLLPSLIFLGTSDVLLSTLYALRRFRAPAFATLFYHLGIIAGAWFLARPLGIMALPVGALAGAAAQAAVQVPAVLRAGVRPHIRIAFTPPVRQILKLYLPVSAGLVITLVGQIIDLNLKASVASHVISWMATATTFTQFPIGITVAALSFAILPSISSDVAFQRPEQFKETLAMGIRLVLFLTVPAAIGLVVAATPVINLVQADRFSPHDTAETVKALVGYALQIPFVGLDQLLIVAFYARRNTVTPMLIGVLGVGIYVSSALLLIHHLNGLGPKVFGLALASSIQNSLHGLILLGLLIAAIGPFGGKALWWSVARTLAAGIAMGVVTDIVVHRATSSLGVVGTRAHLGVLAVTLLVAAATYLAAAALLRSPELSYVSGLARNRFARSAQ